MAWWDDVVADITNWASNTWDTLTGITDEVGKGIAWVGQGIVSFGRSIWDAICSFGEYLWNALINMGQAFRNGLTDIGNGIWWAFQQFGHYLKLAFDSIKAGFDWIGNKLYDFGQWLWGGISWIGSQLYNFGAWLWDGICWIGETVWDGLKWIGGNIWSGLKGFAQWLWSGICWLGAQVSKIAGWIWNTITGFFKTIYDTARTWIGGLTTGVNTWMSSILTNFKNKIDDILFANMMVLGSKKIITNLTEHAGDAHSLGDVGYHVIGNLCSGIALPIVGIVMKEVLAATVKGVGGTNIEIFPPESAELKYMPEYEYTAEEVPIEDREPYREDTPQYDSGYTPSISHGTPSAGTPPSTPTEVGTPFTPPETPTPTEVPYTPPEPQPPGMPGVAAGGMYAYVEPETEAITQIAESGAGEVEPETEPTAHIAESGAGEAEVETEFSTEIT